jgi:Baseplate structural protein Gp10, C-terminal domain
MAVKKINLGRVRGNVDSSSVIEFAVPEEYTEPVSGGKLFEVIGNFVRAFRNVFSSISDLNLEVNNLTTTVQTNTDAIEDILNGFLNKTHPIGEIYMSADSANPSSKFGGTWIAWGTGRVPVGVNASDSNFDTVEKTGGDATVTLNTNQIPSHSHNFRYTTDAFVAGTIDHFNNVVRPLTETGSSLYATSTTGLGAAHNNLQPYITCYMWKRTA